ncbi:competence/damage-inducible protein A [Salipaludibacillus neizhouensis]|uniref:Putative competence-damage inducible protein n=1 Tax=Salipaludibacillus neizhouensis TaxID=885475 RepID=A0A3A9KHM6_9BACI|nr:competence/damage-inducible protein A [Salipaludibacillus neizhouensis]RKL69063.1 competence/damage-inducible protein A [Salipaludibacillus neizhouensis]
MNAEIIAVGSELLLGQIENSNATFLSSELSKLGIDVYHHVVVGDNEARLEKTVETALERSDLLILTGGLGPTKDDITKEILAKVTGRELVYDENTEARLHAYFAGREKKMTENNLKQALIIQGSYVFPNDHGLACGMAVDVSGKKVILLPGPPTEMIPMFERYTGPFLQQELHTKDQIQSKVLRFFNIGESQLVHEIDDIIESQTNPTVAPLASGGEVTLRLTVKGTDASENELKLEELKQKIVSRVSPYFYGEGEAQLHGIVVDRLQELKLSIGAAESLTGGDFSSTLTEVAGSSSVFKGAIICYSNAVKEAQLSVPQEVLTKEGAVSKRCAELLALNVKKLLKTDVGISFTGVAGPDSLEGKSAGLVYIGIAVNDNVEVFKLQLAGSRKNIRERAAKHGFYYLLHELSKEKVDE